MDDGIVLRSGAFLPVAIDFSHATVERVVTGSVGTSVPEKLVAAMQDTGLPHLPGASTVSEVLRLLELGYSEMKLFPAEVSGGIGFLKAIGGPVPQARFCPTGGITESSAPSYLSLPNVGCVGGTWLTPADALADKDWARITRLASDTSALSG